MNQKEMFKLLDDIDRFFMEDLKGNQHNPCPCQIGVSSTENKSVTATEFAITRMNARAVEPDSYWEWIRRNVDNVG